MKLILSLLAVAALASCSSPPKVVVPDGSGRKPINSEVRISDYRLRTGEEQVAVADRNALTRQVAFLQGEIQQLKMYVIQLSTIATSGDAVPARALAPVPAASSTSIRIIPAGQLLNQLVPIADTESLEIREGAVIFRVRQPYAKAEFRPSASFQEELLASARGSSRIDVRGRTDSRAENGADRTIAERRALCARTFLIDNGISAEKIHVSFLAAGDRLVSNATPQGRSINRRVEIETTGLDARKLRGDGSLTIGGL